MADFLDEKRKEIQARLEGTQAGRRGVQPAPGRRRGARRARQRHRHAGGRRGRTSPRRPHGARAAPRGGGTGAKRGRPKGGGTRAAQALHLVTDRPGITIPELAEAMGIQQNYLYRVMPGLAEEGKVTKSGRGWHLREGATHVDRIQVSPHARTHLRAAAVYSPPLHPRQAKTYDGLAFAGPDDRG